MPPIGGLQQAYRLDRIEKLVEILGNPQHEFKVVHVAGTSGKTSTCYYMASLLQLAGKKVGLTVSPHVDQVNERLQINLIPLEESRYCAYFTEFLELVTASKIKPTYFELLVAFAYWVFAKEKVEYAVVEVGLGGLLDSTNVIMRPDKVCVITDIGLDHTHILGRTLAEIAAQKAGIIKPHNPVFMYEQDEAVMTVAREVCEQQHAELHEVWPLAAKELPTNLPLFQRRNWYLAWSVYQFVRDRDGLSELNERQIQESTEVLVPARMEIIELAGKIVVMDGAHNPQKMQAFIKSLKSRFPKAHFAVMFALANHKNESLKATLKVITPVASHLIITSFDVNEDNHHRSVAPMKVAEAYHTMGYDNWETISNPEQAFAALCNRPEEVIVVTGSFYLLNHVRPYIKSVL
jgi:dihydrofolate synthase/folylpolyglutamate synthase